MSERPRKLLGGEAVACGLCLMPQIRMSAEHNAAIRDGSMTEAWFEGVADQCWAAARQGYIAQIKRTLRAHAAMQLPGVDRRPTRLSLMKSEGGESA